MQVMLVQVMQTTSNVDKCETGKVGKKSNGPELGTESRDVIQVTGFEHRSETGRVAGKSCHRSQSGSESVKFWNLYARADWQCGAGVADISVEW